ncbi:hypothetical protein [Actinomadura opuntiae]|uniref:hypothetical protein n=1 Tax=Actinomadura sp. OS1-43 TaxID=604315 RepID=UPI00255A9593|nr:hypothetical protein [Actinomadura sp. OS1-43]MDL4817129.1 hypothetical protein [Actinomadura sp. OS1-43]
MSTAIMVVIAVIIVAAVAAVAFLAWKQARTRRLKRRFGPEYERAVQQHGGRTAAERELLGRERRHEELELRDLDPRRREEYREQWVRVQERFVDAPESAVEQADGLVTVVMGERGYPTHGFEEKVAHLSVEHGRTLDHYRRAHDISGRAAGKQASTEDLRQAMVHYRALFEELLSVPAQSTATEDAGNDAPRTPAEPEPEAAASGRHAGTGPGTEAGARVPGPRTGDHAADRTGDRAAERDDEQTPRS